MHRITVLKGLALGLVMFSTLLPSQLSYSQESQHTHSYQSWSARDRYVRHRNFLAYIEPVVDEQSSKDAAFITVPGLAGRCNSFEARYLRGYYLRHQNSRLKLAKMTGEQTFRQDATFCLRDGLASAKDYSFESFNFQKHYIRHRDFELLIGQDDGSAAFKKDATFIQTPPVPKPVKHD